MLISILFLLVFTGAVVFSVGIFCFPAVLRERFNLRDEDSYFALIFFLILCSCLIDNVSATRIVDYSNLRYSLDNAVTIAFAKNFFWSKVADLFLYGAFFLIAAKWVEVVFFYPRYRPFNELLNWLALSFILYFFFTFVISSIDGEVSLAIKYIWITFSFLLLCFVIRFESLKNVLSVFQIFILLIAYSSLVFALYDPARAFEQNYVGVIPGLSMRLYGVMQHPNTLAPLVFLFLVVDKFALVKLPFRFLNYIVVLAVIFLCQSKTVYISLVMFFFLVWLFPNKNNNPRLFFVGVLLVIGLLIYWLMQLFGLSSIFDLSVYTSSIDTKSLTTFTGRTLIWDITLAEWERNFWFGYGSGLWGPEYRASYGLSVAGHAHNQFIHTLGESGLFGFFSLIIFLCVITFLCIKLAKKTNMASLGILASIYPRLFSEVPMRIVGLNDPSMVMLGVLILILCFYQRVASNENP